MLAEPFHAGLPADQREATQRRWSCGKTMVVCSTIAFGMGIDKSDVRLVVHWGCECCLTAAFVSLTTRWILAYVLDLYWICPPTRERAAVCPFLGPQSLEAYHQESGRAGRDVLPARCVLFAPMTTLPSLLPSRGRSAEAYAACAEMLRACHEYAIQTTSCRRQMLLEHFGERFEPDGEGNARCCDVCDSVAGRLSGTVSGHLVPEPEALIQPAARMIRRAY